METIITWVFICTTVLSEGMLKYKASGHSWFKALLASTETLIICVVSLLVIALVVGIVHDAIMSAIDMPTARRRAKIEARFPGTRATLFGASKWLVTDTATGRTRCEIAQDGVTVIAGDIENQRR